MNKLSLQEQLLKAGLTTKSKANKAKSTKRKQFHQQKNKVNVVNEAEKLAQLAKEKQLEKDKALNEAQNKKAEKKQIRAQITQLVNLHKLPKDDEGNAFNFSDANKIMNIYIADALRTRIIAGTAVIVKSKNQYEVVPSEIAEKIAQRDSSRVIRLKMDAKADKNSDYSGYDVPDDLMW